MGNWTRTKAAGLLFAAAAAVYSDGLVRAMAAEKETSSTTDAAASQPTTNTKKPAAAKPAAAKPAGESKAGGSAKKLAESPLAGTKLGEKLRPALEAADEAAAASEDAAAAVDPFETAPTPVSSSATPAEPLTDANVNVSDAGLVEIHVNEANLGEVLRMLSAQLERNIMASKEVRGTVTANLYDVTVKEALEAILRANDCAYLEKGNVIYVYTKKEMEAIQKEERQQVTETFRVFYTPAANVVNMLKPVLSSESEVSFTTPPTTGIESGGGGKDAGGTSHAVEDTILIRDYPENIEAARKVIKEVDRRPQQILVEAVILRATLNETNELGVDFTVLGGVDFNALTNIGGAIAGNTPTGEMADKGAGSLEAGGSGLKLGVITNNVSVFVNALEGVTDTAVLANPKVLVLNKQQGAVHVGARLGYRTAVSTETLTADDVKFLEIGTRLNFRPYIADDGYVRMEISPKDSSGSVNAQGLPSEFVTEVTTNVMVRDGKTIVIGGLFRESSDSNRSQVPGLGNIPVAGRLFKKQKDQTIREEVIILLTPHVIKDEEVYNKMSEKEREQTERLRVGVRRGMMPWGRERLAETAYEKAVEEMAKPNPDRKRALWHLNCATNLNPKFTEAIELKAQITGEEVTSVDNSTIKSFVSRLALQDRHRPAPPTTMPSDEEAKKSESVAPEKPVAAAPAAAPASPATQPTTKPSAVAEAIDADEVIADEAIDSDLDTREAAPSGFDKSTLVELDLDEAAAGDGE